MYLLHSYLRVPFSCKVLFSFKTPQNLYQKAMKNLPLQLALSYLQNPCTPPSSNLLSKLSLQATSPLQLKRSLSQPKDFSSARKLQNPPQPSKSNLTFSESFLPSCLKTTKQKLSPQKISVASNLKTLSP